MNAYVKQQLRLHNIPINEVQLNLLFLMYSNEGMTSEEMLHMGNFSLSTLLFNMNNLQNANLLNTNEDMVSTNMHKKVNISHSAYNLLEKIEEIFAKNGDSKFYNELLNYEKNLNKEIKK